LLVAATRTIVMWRSTPLAELNAITGLAPAHAMENVLSPGDLHQEAQTVIAPAPSRRKSGVDARGIAPAVMTEFFANVSAVTTMMRKTGVDPIANSKDLSPLTPYGPRSQQWRRIAAAPAALAVPQVALPIDTWIGAGEL
jgi:hypothetical protein